MRSEARFGYRVNTTSDGLMEEEVDEGMAGVGAQRETEGERVLFSLFHA